jgi:hypothetical protein
MFWAETCGKAEEGYMSSLDDRQQLFHRRKGDSEGRSWVMGMAQMDIAVG